MVNQPLATSGQVARYWVVSAGLARVLTGLVRSEAAPLEGSCPNRRQKNIGCLYGHAIARVGSRPGSNSVVVLQVEIGRPAGRYPEVPVRRSWYVCSGWSRAWPSCQAAMTDARPASTASPSFIRCPPMSCPLTTLSMIHKISTQSSPTGIMPASRTLHIL